MQLLIIDTTQIQSYIFGSNRLRENIGASYLVAQATTEWALQEMPSPSNIADSKALKWWNDKKITDLPDHLTVEVIYVGGGNVVALFKDENEAVQFTRCFSRRMLAEIPGLQLVIHHQSFTPVSDKRLLYDAVQDCFRGLARKKRQRAFSTTQLGLSVTEMCRSTSLPAVTLSKLIGNERPQPISAEIKAKLDAAEPKGQKPSLADIRLNDYLPCPEGYQYPHDLDDLGRSDKEFSYVAIVHADGNGIGRRIREIGKGESDRSYIEKIRQFSHDLNEATQKALRITLEDLTKKLKSHAKEGDKLVHRSDFGDILAEITLTKGYIPFRPIVFGGDDVTFICDGRLGISLALSFMRHFQEQTITLPDGKGKATASSSVIVVKSHYPFAQAYALVENISKEAKKYGRKIGKRACLDWHFARSGLLGSIEDIRKREYTVNEGYLTLRPITLDENPEHLQRSWTVIERGVREFQDWQVKREKADWSVRRNKVKALREVLREGPIAVTQFRTKFNEGKNLPDVGTGVGMGDWSEKGWQGGYCGYFDAIELMDWFIPLEEVKNEL